MQKAAVEVSGSSRLPRPGALKPGSRRAGRRRFCAIGLAFLAATAGAQAPVTEAPPAQSQADERFDVWEFRVLGNTALPQVDVERAVYPFLGADQTIAIVEKARAALEKQYKDAGLGAVFVDIPEQEVARGIVRLRVTEGRLDRVRVTGARYFSNRAIREKLPVLEPGSVLKLPELQEQLMAVNQQARDRSVVPVLKAGREPGSVDVELKVTDKLPMHGTVEVNDRYTADTSRTRVNATWSFDNLWQRFHSLSLQYQTAPEEPKEARVIAATYVAPLQNGNIFAAFAVDTDSEFSTIGPEFGPLGVIGRGQIYGARYIVPLPQTPGLYQNFTFGGDYKDFMELIEQPDGTPADTPITYFNWLASYVANARSDRALSTFDLGANFGIRRSGNSSKEFHFKRFSGQPNKGEPNYFYVRGSASHERPLWRQLVVGGRVLGQYSPGALISNEQLALGGVESIRGYLESEYLGDIGVSGNLELRWNALTGGNGQRPWLFQPYTFFDAGIVAIQEPLPQQQRRIDLSSWGAGLNLEGFGFQGALVWAYPLIDSEDTLAGDSRLHFKVRYIF